jgi:hypothetical protein
MMTHELEIGCGHSVRVFNDATQLASVADHCHSSAFVVSAFDHNMHASPLIINDSSGRMHALWYGGTTWTL